MTKQIMTTGALAFLTLIQTATAQYPGWKQEGTFYILTTPEGANLPANATEVNFPVLVRLNKGTFDFAQAKADGADLRFSAAGMPLAYQIEEWDPAKGTASIWVKIPVLKGNAHQEIKIHWGKTDALNESNGAAVFNTENGYATVMHMDENLKDEAGSITPINVGSTVVTGVIGKGRNVMAGKGINGGDHVTNYPFSNAPFTSEIWCRSEAYGAPVFGWGRYAKRFNGKTGDGNEVVITIGAPPSISWGSDGPGGANATIFPMLGQWYHVAATYSNGVSQIFVNGQLEGSRKGGPTAMSMMNDVCMTIGGMRGSYRFTGDVDEVRVSRVARSVDWLRLEYENQKSSQSLVGCLVQQGNSFSASPSEIKVDENKSVTITATAGGARKIFWIKKCKGEETVVAVDQFSYTLDAGRVAGDTEYVLQLKAVYPNEVKIRDIPVKIKEQIPEPIVTLRVPSKWDGRERIEVTPNISNLAAMKAKGAGELTYTWSISGGAVIKEVAPDRLILKRSQCSNKIKIKLALSNGGAETIAIAELQIKEPKQDVWVQRVPGKDEKPENNQFYARDDKNEGTLFYNGSLSNAAESVFLKLYADGKLIKNEKQKPAAGSYAFAMKLKPGLIQYTVEFGTLDSGSEKVLQTVTNLICGDAYIIDGQSNAEATGPNNGPDEDPITPITTWIRSYGNQLLGTTKGGWGNAVRTHIWGKPNYGNHQIGAWGMGLATNLVTKYNIPVCFLNGAYGGTPIWQHQANPTNHYDTSGEFYRTPYKIYGGLLTRVTAAKLTHGIRGAFWHQGENDSSSGAPTGDWNYKSYQQYFIDMSATWKQDYPNLKNYYIYQIWPLPCNMGPKDDQIREAQRTLPLLYSNMRVMSTVGAANEHAGRGIAHFDLPTYATFANYLCPLVEQDIYGFKPQQAITAPNLKRAWFTSAAKDELALDFGQPVVWRDTAKSSFYLDAAVAPIASGTVVGDVLMLKLSKGMNAKTVSYVNGRDWNGKPDKLLFGANGIGMLTFADVIIDGTEVGEQK